MRLDEQTKKVICKVLWFHPAATIGGASISLTELLKPLLPEKVSGLVVTPAGSAADRFRELGLDVLTVRGLSQWDNTRFSRYRGLRWLILLRELFFLPGSLQVLHALRKQRAEFDLIHLNEITLLPLGLLAKRLLGLPLVVHVRSLQPDNAVDIRSRWINEMLLRKVDAVVAIDDSVCRTLPAELPVQVIHNVLQVDNTAIQAETDSVRPFKVAMVGGLLALKGVYEFVEAARICKQRGLAITFVIAGENVRELHGLKGWLLARFGFSRDVRADLERMIHDYALEEMVELKGFVRKVSDLYLNIDLLCFPSHLNAAGRPVFEAAFFGVPSVVAVDDPPADSLIHGVTGLAIPARNSLALADAITQLCQDRQSCRRMGEAAHELAEKNYSPGANAGLLDTIYHRVTGTEM